MGQFFFLVPIVSIRHEILERLSLSPTSMFWFRILFFFFCFVPLIFWLLLYVLWSVFHCIALFNFSTGQRAGDSLVISSFIGSIIHQGLCFSAKRMAWKHILFSYLTPTFSFPPYCNIIIITLYIYIISFYVHRFCSINSEYDKFKCNQN